MRKEGNYRVLFFDLAVLLFAYFGYLAIHNYLEISIVCGKKVLMSYQRKTWQEKLADNKGLPSVFEISAKQRKRWGSGTCVIPAPTEVDELMRCVPKGKLTTIDELRKALAARHRATIACPITVGIFAWVAAHAAAEAEAAGKKRTTAYWRTLKTGGEVNPKYPGGVQALKQKLTAEGHKVVQKRKRFFVQDFASKLARLNGGHGALTLSAPRPAARSLG